jgi:hypothetical protein
LEGIHHDFASSAIELRSPSHDHEIAERLRRYCNGADAVVERPTIVEVSPWRSGLFDPNSESL